MIASARSIRRFLVALLALGLSFVLGVVLGAQRGWLQPVASITVVNETGQALTHVQIAYSSSRSTGTVRLPPLPVGDRATARIHLAGDGGYLISAVQADGTALPQREGYAQPGYELTEMLDSSEGTTSMDDRSNRR